MIARIVHLSDLHFGTVRQQLVQPLLHAIHSLAPRVVVVSGDLTQRAKRSQFAAAAMFLDKIHVPKVTVPGNHDIALWNVYRRFVHPLFPYQRLLGGEVEPTYQDKNLLILGINTARSSVWMGGRISYEQMERLESRFNSAPAHVIKAVVMHHPIVPSTEALGVPLVGRNRKALAALVRAQADLVFAGHVHHKRRSEFTT